MTNSLSKSLSRIFFPVFLIAFVIAIFNLPLIFKKPFLNIKTLIEKNLGEKLDKKVSIGSLTFLPYGEVVLYDIRVDNKNSAPYADIKKCNIRFRIAPLVMNRTVVISQLRITKPVIIGELNDLKYPMERRRALSQYKVEVDEYMLAKIISGRLVFSENGAFRDEVGFDLWVRLIDGDKLCSKGSIDLKNYSLRDYILNGLFFFDFIENVDYDLKASVDGNKLLVEDLILDFDQFKLDAKGAIEDYTGVPAANLNVALKDLNLPEKASLRSKLFITSVRNFIAEIKGALKEPRVSLRLDELRSRFSCLPTALRIDNFYCNVKLSKEEFLVDECSLFLNNFPIGLKAKYSAGISPYLELNIISHPGQIPSLRPLNPLDFEFSFSGHRLEDSIRGKISLQIERLKPSMPGISESMKLEIGDLSCGFSDIPLRVFPEDNTAYLSLNANDIICQANISSRETILNLEGFSSLIYPRANRLYFDNMNVSAYNGSLDGNGFLELKDLSPHFVFDLKFNEFSTADLIRIVNPKHDLAGNLSGEARLDTKAFSYMSGHADISHGHIKDIKILKLIADFLSVPSLKEVYFDDCSSDFLVSALAKEVRLDNLKLRSADISLDANLALGEKQKVKGHMLLRLSTRLLKESLKMRLLFLLLGEGFPYADFEFQIGGFSENPHIKWLDTKFRQTIMRYLSKSGQKAIEKQIEDAIKPLLENK